MNNLKKINYRRTSGALAPRHISRATGPFAYWMRGLLISCLSAALLVTTDALAQQEAEQPAPEVEEIVHPVTSDASARDILEKQKQTDQLLKEQESSGAGRLEDGRTPLTSALTMAKAFRNNDYVRAAEFLDMRYLDGDIAGYSPEKLVRALSFIMNQQLIIDYSTLSDQPEGNTEDGLPVYRDLIATISLAKTEVPIYMQRVPDGKGGRMWKISNATVQQIPAMWNELGFHPLASHLFTLLPDFTFLGMLNWQILGIFIALVAAWLIALATTWAMNRLVQLIPNIFPMGIERFFHHPLRLFLFLILSVKLIEQLGLSLKLRVLLSSSGLSYIAYTILVLGLISLARDYHIRRLQGIGQDSYAALLGPITKMVKVIVIMIVALIWADDAGYNMSTILAGLGVGSLAVALAAQKTLENLIGAITLYSARPIAPGDFCRFGEVTGTVEEIGLRSTAIRTLDRTLVHVPNAMLSSVEIENFTARDRIRYFRNTRVLAESAEQLRVIIAEIRRTLLSHPEVLQETVSVRLDDIDDVAARLRLDAGVNTTNYQAFLAVAEDLNLRIIDIITAAGAALVGPGQLRLVRDGGDSGIASQKVDEMLALWREQDSSPFPDFSPEDKAELSGTLDYPTRP